MTVTAVIAHIPETTRKFISQWVTADAGVALTYPVEGILAVKIEQSMTTSNKNNPKIAT